MKFFDAPSVSRSNSGLKAKPEINANSAQLCLNVRQYGVNTHELLYRQHESMQQRREQLKT